MQSITKSTIELKPNNTKFKINLAIAYHRNKEPAKAIEEYKKIIKIIMILMLKITSLIFQQIKRQHKDGKLALKIAREINELTNFNNHSTLDTLAAALAESINLLRLS